MKTNKGRRVSRQELEKEIFDLKNLLEISKSLSSTLDYNLLNDSILYTCLGALTVMKAAFFSKKSIDSTDFSLHRSFLGFDIANGKSCAIPEKSLLVEFLNVNFRCYTLEELEKALPPSPDLQVLQSIAPSIVVPLRAKGIINGLLILGEKIGGAEFDVRDRDYLLSIGNFAASAIHNAFLFEMTTTDMMTKLKLKHYFMNTLQAKMKVAKEEEYNLSLLMLDIDKFKLLNDTYGHLAGDEVLKSVARTIMEGVRPMDVAARYGGEEFIVLLSNTKLSSACEVAERIRKELEKLTIQFGSNLIKTTISIGVAEFKPDKDLSPQDLIERADHAMYQSKENGRNRFTAAQ